MSIDDKGHAETASRTHRIPWRRLLVLGGVSLALFLGGLACQRLAPEPRVESVLLEQKAGLVELPDFNDAGGQLDFYLKLVLAEGPEETEVKKGPIGNGLSFVLDSRPPLPDLLEVQVWDQDTFRDDILDRISLRGLRASGQTYTVELSLMPDSPLKLASWSLLGLGSLLGLLTLLLVVRRFAV